MFKDRWPKVLESFKVMFIHVGMLILVMYKLKNIFYLNYSAAYVLLADVVITA